jgi:hypothetical protein
MNEGSGLSRHPLSLNAVLLYQVRQLQRRTVLQT